MPIVKNEFQLKDDELISLAKSLSDAKDSLHYWQEHMNRKRRAFWEAVRDKHPELTIEKILYQMNSDTGLIIWDTWEEEKDA